MAIKNSKSPWPKEVTKENTDSRIPSLLNNVSRLEERFDVWEFVSYTLVKEDNSSQKEFRFKLNLQSVADMFSRTLKVEAGIRAQVQLLVVAGKIHVHIQIDKDFKSITSPEDLENQLHESGSYVSFDIHMSFNNNKVEYKTYNFVAINPPSFENLNKIDFICKKAFLRTLPTVALEVDSESSQTKLLNLTFDMMGINSASVPKKIIKELFISMRKLKTLKMLQSPRDNSLVFIMSSLAKVDYKGLVELPIPHQVIKQAEFLDKFGASSSISGEQTFSDLINTVSRLNLDHVLSQGKGEYTEIISSALFASPELFDEVAVKIKENLSKIINPKVSFLTDALVSDSNKEYLNAAKSLQKFHAEIEKLLSSKQFSILETIAGYYLKDGDFDKTIKWLESALGSSTTKERIAQKMEFLKKFSFKPKKHEKQNLTTIPANLGSKNFESSSFTQGSSIRDNSLSKSEKSNLISQAINKFEEDNDLQSSLSGLASCFQNESVSNIKVMSFLVKVLMSQGEAESAQKILDNIADSKGLPYAEFTAILDKIRNNHGSSLAERELPKSNEIEKAVQVQAPQVGAPTTSKENVLNESEFDQVPPITRVMKNRDQLPNVEDFSDDRTQILDFTPRIVVTDSKTLRDDSADLTNQNAVVEEVISANRMSQIKELPDNLSSDQLKDEFNPEDSLFKLDSSEDSKNDNLSFDAQNNSKVSFNARITSISEKNALPNTPTEDKEGAMAQGSTAMSIPPMPGNVSANNQPGLGEEKESNFNNEYSMIKHSNWRQLVSQNMVEKGLTSRFMSIEFSKIEEQHIAVQALGLIGAELTELKSWPWKVWRSPTKKAYDSNTTERFDHQYIPKIIKSDEFKSLLSLSPVFYRVHHSKYSSKGLANKVSCKEEEVDKLSKRLDYNNHILDFSGVGQHKSFMGFEKLQIRNLKGLKNHLFYHYNKNCLYFDEDYYGRKPVSHFYHAFLKTIISLKLEYYILLSLNARTQVYDMITGFANSSENAFYKKLYNIFKNDRNLYAKQMGNVNPKYLYGISKSLAAIPAKNYDKIWEAMEQHIYLLSLAMNLDLVGMCEHLCNANFFEKNTLSPSEIYSYNPIIPKLLKGITTFKYLK